MIAINGASLSVSSAPPGLAAWIFIVASTSIVSLSIRRYRSTTRMSSGGRTPRPQRASSSCRVVLRRRRTRRRNGRPNRRVNWAAGRRDRTSVGRDEPERQFGFRQNTMNFGVWTVCATKPVLSRLTFSVPNAVDWRRSRIIRHERFHFRLCGVVVERLEALADRQASAGSACASTGGRRPGIERAKCAGRTPAPTPEVRMSIRGAGTAPVLRSVPRRLRRATHSGSPKTTWRRRRECGKCVMVTSAVRLSDQSECASVRPSAARVRAGLAFASRAWRP